MAHSTLRVDTTAGVARLQLARPDFHNAFDETMISELTVVLKALGDDPAVRVVVLSGEGRSFCAGADLNWMKRAADYDRAANLADAQRLADMLETLATLAKPTLALVTGNAFGGGVGLIACCDIALATPRSRFAISEARLGIIPATVGPYVVRAIGTRAAQRYFLSAEMFDAQEALRIGLLHEVVAETELAARAKHIIDALLSAGPSAQAAAKDLLRAIAGRPIDGAVIGDTVQRIAAVRAGDEAKEGIRAFLEKRAPGWTRR